MELRDGANRGEIIVAEGARLTITGTLENYANLYLEGGSLEGHVGRNQPIQR